MTTWIGYRIIELKDAVHTAKMKLGYLKVWNLERLGNGKLKTLLLDSLPFHPEKDSGQYCRTQVARGRII